MNIQSSSGRGPTVLTKATPAKTPLTRSDSRLADIIADKEPIFANRQRNPAALAARARNVLAGGVTSNWQITEPQPVWLSHGAGAKVYDADGNEYVDLHGGYGAPLAGHAPPALVAPVRDQVAGARTSPSRPRTRSWWRPSWPAAGA